MTIVVCGQYTGRDAECPECGGALHVRGGEPVVLADGPTVCDSECAASYTDRAQQSAYDNHLHLRDLLCGCLEVCGPLGLPTAAMRAEYAAYRADRPPR